MTQKEHILTEWLLQNNSIWYNLDEVSKGQNKCKNNSSYYSDYYKTDEMCENNSEEIKLILSKRNNWYTVCPALFAGDLVYFENESFISDEDFAESRKNLCEWILKNRIKITDKGISVVHNNNYCKTNKNSSKINAECVPRIESWYSKKDVVEPRTKMKRISSFVNDSSIVIRNTSLFYDNRLDSLHNLQLGCITSLDELSEILNRFTSESEDGIKYDFFRKLLYKNSLACKFNEVDDFVYVEEIGIEKKSIFTLDNFPNLVRGNLVIEKCYFLNDYSGFPKRVNGSVYLNSLTNGAVTDSHKIIGVGGTSVTSDANGNITINSANTASIADLMGNTAKGSATQPIYWNGTEWVNTTYTLGKSVPSDAKFTDTWRGIQNNLTSTSTTDSLSAAQGKILNDKLGTQCTYSLSGTTLTITPK